ncbi:hypothetical protein HDU98_008595 [Podochytrium sp. JEL0797]|nr:hypothetical protein HDU98_008595 [Podochytrium sp. JEL0797]
MTLPLQPPPADARPTKHHLASSFLPAPPLYGTAPTLHRTVFEFITLGPHITHGLLAHEFSVSNTHLYIYIEKLDSTGASQPADSRAPSPPKRLARQLVCEYLSAAHAEHHAQFRRISVHLFARSQPQYLFPGSASNGKRVLKDEDLVQWWARTLETAAERVAGSSEQPQCFAFIPGAEEVGFKSRCGPGFQVGFGFGTVEREKGKQRIATASSTAVVQNGAAMKLSDWIPRFPDDAKTKPLNSKKATSIQDLMDNLPYTGECYGRVSAFFGVFFAEGREAGNAPVHQFPHEVPSASLMEDEVKRFHEALMRLDFSSAEKCGEATTGLVDAMEQCEWLVYTKSEMKVVVEEEPCAPVHVTDVPVVNNLNAFVKRKKGRQNGGGAVLAHTMPVVAAPIYNLQGMVKQKKRGAADGAGVGVEMKRACVDAETKDVE